METEQLIKTIEITTDLGRYTHGNNVYKIELYSVDEDQDSMKYFAVVLNNKDDLMFESEHFFNPSDCLKKAYEYFIIEDCYY